MENATRQPSSLNIDDIASINLSGGSIEALSVKQTWKFLFLQAHNSPGV